MPRAPIVLLPLLLLASAATHASSPAPAPPPPAWLAGLDARYDGLRVAGLEDRQFAPEDWWAVATPLLAADRGFTVEDIGRSAEGRPLRHVAWGEGPVRVLLWSQMHGDESTASMALADLVHFLGTQPDDPLVQRLRTGTTLHLMPIVNPDGAARFQRRNAQGVDVNRDARALATPEGRALHDLRERLQPHFGFNLHDQHIGYRAGDSDRATAIALLAPAYNEARDVDATRGRAIEVAVAIRAALEPYIAGHIARWDDTYNPRAFGDLTAGAGVSTILVESGGLDGDPQKQRLRRLNFLGLLAALDAIATGRHAGLPHEAYATLPENGEVWPDLLLRGGTLALPGRPHARVDVLVDFAEPLSGEDGRIADVGDLAGTRARRTVDATGLYVLPLQGEAATAAGCGDFATGARACFHLSRDPAGRDLVWTLAGDERAPPPRASTTAAPPAG